MVQIVAQGAVLEVQGITAAVTAIPVQEAAGADIPHLQEEEDTPQEEEGTEKIFSASISNAEIADTAAAANFPILKAKVCAIFPAEESNGIVPDHQGEGTVPDRAKGGTALALEIALKIENEAHSLKARKKIETRLVPLLLVTKRDLSADHNPTRKT